MSDLTTEMILIRHGETAWNMEHRMQGQIDISLNETGLAQAAALARRFGAGSLQAVYSSDLDRAYRTAGPIAARGGHVVQRDERLRERHYGVLQGLTRHEAMARHPSHWEALFSRHPEAELEGGESLNAFSRRVLSLLNEVHERHAGQRVLLVTHGGVLDAVYRAALGKPWHTPRDFPIRNASVNVLLRQQDRWHVESWGDISHLEGGTSLEDY